MNIFHRPSSVRCGFFGISPKGTQSSIWPKPPAKLGINRTTLLRILKTLESEKLIEPRGEENQGWRIGLGLIGLAAQAFPGQ